MKKFILILFTLILSSLIISCNFVDDKKTIENTDLKIEPTELKISSKDTLGADMAILDYASDDIIIFHGSFGLFVFDTKSSKVIKSIDLEPINCISTQGDNLCVVSVNKDGTIIQLHNISSERMYIYTLKDNLLIETPYKPMENSFELIPTPENIKGNDIDYSYESVKFDNGDLGYLTASDSTVGSLKYIRGDTSYTLFK
ncbi:hypothetical protein [Clostridium sardiniense]|uniref:hypothetical protein n=1 Tax=Clostridium sardiniense TaxID=29369 RepID=UPI003D34D29D